MKKVQWSKGEWLILLVVALAFLLRIWPLGYMAYAGEANRISFITYDFIHEGKIPRYGYDNWNFYGHYGPMPYYIFSFFSLLSTAPFSPVLLTILLSTVTTYVLYRIGKDFWDKRVGFIAALLWATSHLSVITSRTAFTVNIAPVFVSLFFYSLLVLLHKKKSAYYVLLFLLAGIILQIHITVFTVLLLVIPALFLGMPLNKKNRKGFLVGCCILLILFLPYISYEASHGFSETRKLLTFISPFSRGEKMAVTTQDWDDNFLLQYVNPLEKEPRTNSFLQNIANMFYFCEDPSQYSPFMGFMGGALRFSAIMAWLLFLPLPFLFCLWLVRKHKNKHKELGSIEFKGSILLLIWFILSLFLQSHFPFHDTHHFHSLSLSTILFWAVGWGWLLPLLMKQYKQGIRLFALLFVFFLVIVNGVSWAAFHISNPQKECLSTGVPLSALEDIAEVLAEDQRFKQQPEEALLEIVSTHGTIRGKLAGLEYVTLDAIRRREQAGGQFLNLSGRYILIREKALPFGLNPALPATRIGSSILVRQPCHVDASSLFLAKAGDARDIESARVAVSDHLEPWNLGEPWPPIDAWRCIEECPLVDSQDCQRCLGTSTLYLRIHLSKNRTARTALVVNELNGDESHIIEEVYLNDEPLFYNGSLLVPGENRRPQEILMDVTGLLNDSTNLLEVLIANQPGRLWPYMLPDIYTISGS